VPTNSPKKGEFPNGYLFSGWQNGSPEYSITYWTLNLNRHITKMSAKAFGSNPLGFPDRRLAWIICDYF
jgi:hypothetical protein